MDPHTLSLFSTVGTIGFLINSSINVSRRIFELRDVEKQAKDVLEISNGMKKMLQHTRRLRRQKSQLLSTLEKDMIDTELSHAEKAVANLALLVEPARADMHIHNGNVTVATRGLFVLRDLPKITASLSRLQFAYYGLCTVMGILCNRGSVPTYPKHEVQPEPKYPPPSYEDSQFLNSKRHSVIFKEEPVELGIESAAEMRQATESTPVIEVTPAVLADGPDMSGLQVDWREQPRWQPGSEAIGQPQHQTHSAGRARTPDPDSTSGNPAAPRRRIGGRSRGQIWLTHRASFQEIEL
ncbi:hypothetical protein BFW01_g5172 [Lasiodiplodia theobromae]|uniref:Uncharacterized protein n=1 Tax=Lasiodiplodia theobromae TaxID=45133 RepID=A0A5N5CYM3_9PEZI|nr:uncharacterized protein LTHEOB_1951 [Lasiodiplodia theobromae]KAB2570460.1 hypothetical protein DBV05_g10885 [Lasiodiplodia theobromae]KAF4536190.1 hypothetical protein LTHEOB_1951 [Lasiodiplodia theobromae]KAF9634277.1 hypothetical protein BFW01_g5172 [Lasiodiplodia theobromae]